MCQVDGLVVPLDLLLAVRRHDAESICAERPHDSQGSGSRPSFTTLNAKTLSVDMGHATIAITLNLYGHLMPGAEDEATEMLDAFFARHGGSTTAQTAGHPEKVPV
jgi:integrase